MDLRDAKDAMGTTWREKKKRQRNRIQSKLRNQKSKARKTLLNEIGNKVTKLNGMRFRITTLCLDPWAFWMMTLGGEEVFLFWPHSRYAGCLFCNGRSNIFRKNIRQAISDLWPPISPTINILGRFIYNWVGKYSLQKRNGLVEVIL